MKVKTEELEKCCLEIGSLIMFCQLRALPKKWKMDKTALNNYIYP